MHLSPANTCRIARALDKASLPDLVFISAAISVLWILAYLRIDQLQGRWRLFRDGPIQLEILLRQIVDVALGVSMPVSPKAHGVSEYCYQKLFISFSIPPVLVQLIAQGIASSPRATDLAVRFRNACLCGAGGIFLDRHFAGVNRRLRRRIRLDDGELHLR